MPGGRKRVHDAEEDDEDEMMRLQVKEAAKRAKLTAVPPPLLFPVLQPLVGEFV